MERATFCPRCLRMHPGVCQLAPRPARVAEVVAPKPKPSAPAIILEPKPRDKVAAAVERVEARKRYMRELMRKKRAAAKGAKS